MPQAVVIGVDLVPIDSIAESIAEFGERFLRRIFSEDEIQYCNSRAPRAALESLAARFAAKEAAIKALGAVELGLDFRSIEVVRDGDGACSLRLDGAAARAAHDRGAERLELSMSHAGDYAIAFVVGLQHPRYPQHE